jgi:DNA-directed RNA polymerase I subunit RPA2
MSLEIAYLAPGRHSKLDVDQAPEAVKNYYFPGVFLSSQVSRFVRPVQNLQLGGIEWIGPLEQITLSIACLEEDIRADTTHQELDPVKMLSIIASTVPFADYN